MDTVCEIYDSEDLENISDSQIQEVQVLKSIFSNTLTIEEKDFISIKISVNVSDNFKICNTNDNGYVNNTLDNDDDVDEVSNTTTTTTTTAPYTIASQQQQQQVNYINDVEKNTRYLIKYLPDITLELKLSPDYPESSSPKIYISSCWLTNRQMKKILKELNSMWEPGESVIYRYITWIKEEMMLFLGINEYQILHSETMNDHEEYGEEEEEGEGEGEKEINYFWEQLQDNWTSLESVLPYLLEYNEKKIEIEFRKESHTCPICDCEYQGSEFNLFRKCNHFICNDCSRQMFKVNILDEMNLTMLKCTEPGCEEPFDPATVKKLISSEEEYAVYQRLLLRQNGHVECARCSDGWATIETQSQTAFCSKCYHTMCLLCKKTWHPGATCTEIEKQLKRAQLKSGKKTGKTNPNWKVLNAEFRMTDLKSCPFCKSMIYKYAGCHITRCTYCSHRFCWSCLRLLRNNRSAFDTHQCEEKSDIKPVNVFFDKAQPSEQSKDNSQMKCITCKDTMHRYNFNNHLVCTSCKTQHCYLCKSKITTTKHFIENSSCWNWNSFRIEFVPVDRTNLTIATLIRVCGKLTDDATRAKEVVRKLYKKDIESFKEQIKDYLIRGKNEMVQMGLKFFKYSISSKSNNNGLTKILESDRIEIYKMAIGSSALHGLMNQCLELVNELKLDTKMIPIEIENLIVSGYSKSNQPELAYQYLKDHSIHTIVAYNSILECYSRNGQTEKQSKLLDEINRNQIITNHLTIEYLVDGLLNSNNNQNIEKTISILKSTMKTKTPISTQTFHKLFLKLSKLNQLDVVFQVYNDIMLEQNRLIVESLPVDTDFVKIAHEVDVPTDSYTPNINTINVLIEACCHCNDIERAFQTFNQQLPRFNLNPTSETFSNLEALSLKLNRMDLYKKYYYLIEKEQEQHQQQTPNPNNKTSTTSTTTTTTTTTTTPTKTTSPSATINTPSKQQQQQQKLNFNVDDKHDFNDKVGSYNSNVSTPRKEHHAVTSSTTSVPSTPTNSYRNINSNNTNNCNNNVNSTTTTTTPPKSPFSSSSILVPLTPSSPSNSNNKNSISTPQSVNSSIDCYSVDDDTIEPSQQLVRGNSDLIYISTSSIPTSSPPRTPTTTTTTTTPKTNVNNNNKNYTSQPPPIQIPSSGDLFTSENMIDLHLDDTGDYSENLQEQEKRTVKKRRATSISRDLDPEGIRSLVAYSPKSTNEHVTKISRSHNVGISIKHMDPIEINPLGQTFYIKGLSDDYVVTVGHISTCSCPNYPTSNGFCKHMCHVMTHHFKLPDSHYMVRQKGFTDLELYHLFFNPNREEVFAIKSRADLPPRNPNFNLNNFKSSQESISSSIPTTSSFSPSQNSNNFNINNNNNNNFSSSQPIINNNTKKNSHSTSLSSSQATSSSSLGDCKSIIELLSNSYSSTRRNINNNNNNNKNEDIDNSINVELIKQLKEWGKISLPSDISAQQILLLLKLHPTPRMILPFLCDFIGPYPSNEIFLSLLNEIRILLFRDFSLIHDIVLSIRSIEIPFKFRFDIHSIVHESLNLPSNNNNNNNINNDIDQQEQQQIEIFKYLLTRYIETSSSTSTSSSSTSSSNTKSILIANTLNRVINQQQQNSILQHQLLDTFINVSLKFNHSSNYYASTNLYD
eukprot:gene3693-4602_t